MLLTFVAIWAFAEATVFFVVADVPISAIGLRHGWRKAGCAAGVAALAAAVGGQAILHWSRSDPVAVRAMLLGVPAIGPDLLEAAGAAWRQDGFAAMLLGAFRGEPFKLYAHAAGTGHADAALFLLQSVAARLPRFLLVALVSSAIGPQLRAAMADRTIAALFVAGWSAFYAAYFAMMGN